MEKKNMGVPSYISISMKEIARSAENYIHAHLIMKDTVKQVL